MQNLFHNLPTNLDEELNEILAQGEHIRIERIVSTGQTSPPDFWYDQPEHEWVTVLQGEAKLRFEHEPDLLHMKPGDHTLIPAHKKHRVEWTSEEITTVWLALFWS